jgi:tRNA-specific 2-thiouridylase
VPFACSAKSRYRQQDSDCQITALDHSNASVEFNTPQRAVTPGQALVLYDGEQCLGGGTIEAAYNQ